MRTEQLVAAFGALVGVVAGSTFSPAKPPAIPLAVKSPYMSTWLEAGSNGAGTLAGAWPKFWAGPQPGDVAGASGSTTGWGGLIKVDGTSYTWMGAPVINGVTPPSVNQTSFEYTSERSTFIMSVGGKISMNVTFISPITPTDLKRQSVVGTYLDVSVQAIDGATHSVQLYADTSAEWISIHNTDVAQWSYSVQNGIASHQSSKQDQSEFNADYPDDASHWGNWYWSTAASSSMTYQSGADVTVRQNFLDNGNLPSTQDSDFRAINDNWPVFAFANALGDVGSTPVSTLYTIVHAQTNAIYFNGANGLTSVPSLWTSYWSTDLDLVEFFYNDRASSVGQFDHAVAVDSLAAGGQDYLTITSLSVRQAFGAVQLCGTPEKPYVFLKEISSDGNIQTVDVLFPAIPIYLYSNPILLKYILDPLYENQEAGNFPQTYAMHDLGANYPRAIGHPTGDGEAMPLEECGNMIIATLAYSQRTNDVAYLTQHYTMLKQWTGYLVDEALIPADQLSTDDFQGTLANQTNLALKGILAIEAMSVIADLTGNKADVTTYHNTATDYLAQWQVMGIASTASPPHTNLAYNSDDTHGLLYNLYADRLLGLNLVPQSIYDMQSAFYPTVVEEYGVPLDTRNFCTKSDWQMWTASISSQSTKELFISKLASFVANTPTSRPFSDMYETQTAEFHSGPFIARPVVGGHFALLALNDAPKSAVQKKKGGGRKPKHFRA